MSETIGTRLEQLRAVAAASNLRSPLARWYAANRDEFAKLLRDYRPRWEALVEQFAKDGLLNLPPDYASDEAVRRRVVKAAMRTWERTKARVSADEKRTHPRVAGSRPAVAPRPTVTTDIAPGIVDEETGRISLVGKQVRKRDD